MQENQLNDPLEMPEVVVKAQPEVTIQGVTHQFTPTIMRCSMGGWIVVLPGKGIIAKSTLKEATDFVGFRAFEELDEPAPDRRPKILSDMERAAQRFQPRQMMHGLAIFVITLLGVKMA